MRDGTSIITPILIDFGVLLPRDFSLSNSINNVSLASSNSDASVIIGNIIYKSLSIAPLIKALICFLSTALLSRVILIDLQPIAGFSSSTLFQYGNNLSEPTSKVLKITFFLPATSSNDL